MQTHLSLVYREEEREMFPTLKALRCGYHPVVATSAAPLLWL